MTAIKPNPIKTRAHIFCPCGIPVQTKYFRKRDNPKNVLQLIKKCEIAGLSVTLSEA